MAHPRASCKTITSWLTASIPSGCELTVARDAPRASATPGLALRECRQPLGQIENNAVPVFRRKPQPARNLHARAPAADAQLRFRVHDADLDARRFNLFANDLVHALLNQNCWDSQGLKSSPQREFRQFF